jgi:hypothetical protein
MFSSLNYIDTHTLSALVLHIHVVGRAAVGRVMEATVNQRSGGKAQGAMAFEQPGMCAYGGALLGVGLLLPTYGALRRRGLEEQMLN